jgi:hypothetical protein
MFFVRLDLVAMPAGSVPPPRYNLDRFHGAEKADMLIGPSPVNLMEIRVHWPADQRCWMKLYLYSPSSPQRSPARESGAIVS